jgi:hypothetical protein
MHGNPRARLSLAALLLSAALALIVATPAQFTAAAAPASVYPPNARVHGRTHGDWAALWARWFISVPMHVDPADPSKGILNPNFETTGATCGVRQSGPVFFLANLHPDTDGAVRRCTVPAGKTLLLPLSTGLCTNGPGERKSVADVQFECRISADVVEAVAVEIDGVAVPDVMSYRVQSKPFPYKVVKDSCCFPEELGYRVGRTYWPAVMEGWFVMIKPLPAGEHVIKYSDNAPIATGQTSATYILTVAAKG